MDEAMERRRVDGNTGWAAHIYNDEKIPDSRYASAVVSDDEGDVEEGVESDSSGFLDELRADPLERTFAIRWLAGLVGQIDTLSVDNPTTDSDEARESLLDEAALLAKFSHQEEDEDFDITRYFSSPSSGKTVHIELNDAPLSTSDHTSVGLQSWGSAIILVERLWTGLLSIAVAKLIPLLANLAVNLHTNFYLPNQSGARVSAVELDWACPAPGVPFDTVRRRARGRRCLPHGPRALDPRLRRVQSLDLRLRARGSCAGPSHLHLFLSLASSLPHCLPPLHQEMPPMAISQDCLQFGLNWAKYP
ncbi:hypothetical protein B0H14DRAFT_3687650 [Mycena olivaceomarginata]|nr:hypothetical protein B0H14DRAFT_3687650 [Mycena olivaceomarginata]